MRIDGALPVFYTGLPQSAAVIHNSPPAQMNNLSNQGVIVDISPEGWAAYAQSKAVAQSSAAGNIIDKDHGCETCDSRRYQDVSSDLSVSFQTPTHISPENSAAKVRAHEYEHIASEQAKAQREGRKVISQSVTLSSSICPECKRVYISGGTARTVTAEENRGEAEKPSETLPLSI